MRKSPTMRLHRPLLISLARNERTTARRLPMPRESISPTTGEMTRKMTGATTGEMTGAMIGRLLPMKAAPRINGPN